MNKFDKLINKILKEELKLSRKITKGWLPKSGGPMLSKKQKQKEQDKKKGRKNWTKGDYE